MVFTVENLSNAKEVELFVKSRKSGYVTLGWTFKDASSNTIIANVTNLVDGWISMDTEGEGNDPLKFPFTDSSLREMTFSEEDGLVVGSEYHAVVTLVMDNGYVLESGPSNTSSHSIENELLFTLYKLDAPQVIATGGDKRIVLSFADELVGLGNMSNNAPDNRVTSISVVLKSNNPRNLQTYNIPVSELRSPSQNLSSEPTNLTNLELVLGSTGQGINLVNDKAYDIVVCYNTKAFNELNDEIVANSLGKTPLTTILNITPTTLSGAPRFVSTERPSGELAADDAIQIWFQAPDNDVNPDLNSTETAMKSYEVYRAKSSVQPSTPFLDGNGNVIDSSTWTLVASPDAKTDYYNGGDGSITEATQMTAVYTLIDSGLDEGGLYWYSIRGIRPTTNADTGVTTDVYGLFSVPVSALVFNYVDVNAPAVQVFTEVGSTSISQTVSYPVAEDPSPPTGATIFTTEEADGLPNYTARWVTNIAGGNEQSYTAGLASDAGTKLYTGLSYGTTYTFNSCIYRQTYNKVVFNSSDFAGEFLSVESGGRVYESANASTKNLISGLNSPASSQKSLTPFTIPSSVIDVSSTGLDSDNTPLSSGTEEGDGKLNVSFTALSSYDNGSRFFSGLRYRIVGTDINFADLTGKTTLTTPTGSNGIEGLQPTNGSVLSTVSGLNIAQSYPLRVQAYFYNDENGEWEFGTESSAVSTGNVPFYYPSAVTGLTLDASGNGRAYAKWNVAVGNGVNESDEVSLSYKVELYTNDAEISSIHQDNTDYDFVIVKGAAYYIIVISEYEVGLTDTYVTSGENVQEFLAVPADPSVELSAGNQSITATFTSGNNYESIVFERWEAQLGNNTPATVVSPFTYTGLTNGQQYVVAVRGAYKYPEGGATFFSDWISSSLLASNTGSIPFGKPIINSANVTNNLITINVNNNGRSLREVLIVALPVDANQTTNNIEIVYRNVSDSNPLLSQGGGNNAISRDITFNLGTGVQISQALLVLENLAGATVALRDSGSS